MKKLIAITLIFVLVLGLVGCGKKEIAQGSEKENKVLKVSGLNGGYGTEGFKAVTAAFEKATGVKVELQLEPNIADVLRPAFSSGKDVPDVVYYSIGGVGALTEAMVNEKQLVPLDDVLEMTIPGSEQKVKDKINDNFLTSKSFRPYDDNGLYLLPLFYSPCGLFFNKGLFEQKGWTVPTTIDELLVLGEKAKQESIALFTYPTTGYFDGFFSSLLNVVVGPEKYNKLMNYDLETWKLPEVKKAFEIVGKLAQYTEKNTVANANPTNFQMNQQLILDNKALFMPNGTWVVGEMKDAPRAEGFKWGFSVVPSLEKGGKAYSSAFVEQIWIPKASTNKEVAKQFLAFLYSDEAVKLFYNQEKSGVVAVKDVEKMLKKEDAEFFGVYKGNNLPNLIGFAAHDAVEGYDLKSADGILYGTVNSVVNGTKTVDDWYNSVIEAVSKYK